MASIAMVPSPKSPPLGPFYTITTHLARGHHSTPTPQHKSETLTPADIAVCKFLYNLRTVRNVTSQVFAYQLLTRGDNIEILPGHYTSQQRAPALSMVLPTIASVDRVRSRLISSCMVLLKLTFELAFQQSKTSQTLEGRKSSLHHPSRSQQHVC